MKITINERENYEINLPEVIGLAELSAIIGRLKTLTSFGKIESELSELKFKGVEKTINVRNRRPANNDLTPLWNSRENQQTFLKLYALNGMHEANAFLKTLGIELQDTSSYNLKNKMNHKGMKYEPN